jgi:hypothetical protein
MNWKYLLLSVDDHAHTVSYALQSCHTLLRPSKFFVFLSTQSFLPVPSPCQDLGQSVVFLTAYV